MTATRLCVFLFLVLLLAATTTSPPLPSLFSCDRAAPWLPGDGRGLVVQSEGLVSKVCEAICCLHAKQGQQQEEEGRQDGWRGGLVEACPCRCVCRVGMSGGTCKNKS